MLGKDLVREIAARRDRGESTWHIASELGVHRKTIRRWLRIGGWRPRQNGVNSLAPAKRLPSSQILRPTTTSRRVYANDEPRFYDSS